MQPFGHEASRVMKISRIEAKSSEEHKYLLAGEMPSRARAT